jgi:hypothetical protein
MAYALPIHGVKPSSTRIGFTLATLENRLRSRLAAGTIRTQHWFWALAILAVAVLLSVALTALTDSLVFRGAGAHATTRPRGLK